jgi:hypothetical protein
MINFENRIRKIIDFCWDSFSAKVGGGLIDVNKEASMQLNFAYLLKNTVDLALHHDDELIEIELETGIPINKRMRECDIVVKISKGEDVCFLPIEMKCYKYLASSGGKRGAVDIFYKDVYADLELLEAYAKVRNFLPGIQLTMTDFRNLPYPPKRSGKYLDYDITHGAMVSDGIHLTTPIGGKEIEIRLYGTYYFEWGQVGNFYFLKLENRSN